MRPTPIRRRSPSPPARGVSMLTAWQDVELVDRWGGGTTVRTWRPGARAGRCRRPRTLLETEATMSGRGRKLAGTALALVAVGTLAMCNRGNPLGPELDRPVDPQLAAEGREIFRFDTFGDEVFWTDTLRLHEVIRKSVSPATALQVGLRVDVDAL